MSSGSPESGYLPRRVTSLSSPLSAPATGERPRCWSQLCPRGPPSPHLSLASASAWHTVTSRGASHKPTGHRLYPPHSPDTARNKGHGRHHSHGGRKNDTFKGFREPIFIPVCVSPLHIEGYSGRQGTMRSTAAPHQTSPRPPPAPRPRLECHRGAARASQLSSGRTMASRETQSCRKIRILSLNQKGDANGGISGTEAG